MMVIISNLWACVVILFITLILNGDLGTKKMPFYGLLRHQRLIQQPYMLLYFYVVSSFIGGLSNSFRGLWLFLLLILIQLAIILFIVSKHHKKGVLEWSHYLSRIKEIFTKIFDKKASERSMLTFYDITYLSQNVVFPCFFIGSNAYLMVNIILILKQTSS